MSQRLADLWRQHMCCGDFEAAWRISDSALHNRDRFAQSSGEGESTWRGEPLEGKRVLVRCCYGLGDTLQFVRYLPCFDALRATSHCTRKLPSRPCSSMLKELTAW